MSNPKSGAVTPARLLGAAARRLAARARARRDPRCRANEPSATDAPPTLATPQRALATLTLDGGLIEGRAALEALIDAELPRLCAPGQAAPCPRQWSGDIEARLRNVLENDLGYRVAIASRATRDKSGRLGWTVRLSVAPGMRVRHVRTDTSWPVLSEDIERRITLRPGSPVPEMLCARAPLLRAEEDAVREYLNGRGYFDARVRMRFEELERDEAALDVGLDLGARYTVGDVVVDGAVAIRPTELAARFRQKTWYSWLYKPTFSRDRMKRDAVAAELRYREAGFPGARVRVTYDPATDVDHKKHTVKLHVTVRERRRVGVTVQGNESLRYDELESAISFNTEGAYDDYEAARSARQLSQEYQRRGWFEAKVGVRRERFPEDDYDTVVFTVEEGKRRPLRQILFTFGGSASFSPDKLAGLIGSKPTRRTFVVRSQGLLTSAQLRFDLERLLEFYRSQGFPQAAVRYEVAPAADLLDHVGALSAVVEGPAAQPGGLVLRFHIDEGPRLIIGAVNLDDGGVALAERAGIDSALRLYEGQPFTAEALRDAVSRLRQHLERRGFPNASIDARHQTEASSGRVRIDVAVRLGQLVRWGHVFVRGNFKTAREVILREVRIDSGERYDPRAADRAESRLRALGLFNSVKLRTLGAVADAGAPVVHLLVEVEERYDYTADIELAFGASSDNVAFVSLALIARNLWGLGHEARIGGELGFEIQAADAAYTVPRLYLGPTPIALRAATFVRNEDTERLGTLLSFGASLALSRELAPGLVASARYDIRQVNRSIALVRGAGHDEDLDAVRLATRTGSVQAQIALDRRNDALLPTAGYRLTGSALLAATELGGSDDFVKLSATGSHYLKLGPRILLAQGVRTDFGLPISSAVLPAVERFFGGGDTTVRGLEEDLLLREVVRTGVAPLPKFEQFRVLPQGGNVRLLHNIDLQVQVARFFGFPISVAVFLDTGIVTNSLRGFTVSQLRHSLGLGLLRWQLPVGFISVEYAIPLDPELGDDPTGRLHFNFGFVF